MILGWNLLNLTYIIRINSISLIIKLHGILSMQITGEEKNHQCCLENETPNLIAPFFSITQVYNV